MSRRPNRIVLLVIALLLVAAGVVMLLAATGALDLLTPAELYEQAQTSAAANPLAWTAGVIVGAIFVMLLGAWLVRRQLRLRPGGRLDTITLEQGDRGRTTVRAASVAAATEADLRSVRGVADSSVRLVTFGPRPRLIVDLDIDQRTSLREVLERSESVYERLCGHLGVDAVHVDTVVRPATQDSQRVA